MKHLVSLFLVATCFASKAHPGIGLIYDGDHTIYYTDLQHIWKVNTISGKSQVFIENVHSHELAMDSIGALYGEHYWYVESQVSFRNYIWKKGRTSELEKIRQDQMGENEDFRFVRDDAFASFFITNFGDDHHIIRSVGGREETLWEGSLNNPSWSALDQNGKFLFADFPGVYRLDSGVLDTLASDLSQSRIPFSLQRDEHHIYGIWTDDSNNVYVAVYGGRSIVKIDNSSNSFQEIYKSDFLWSPTNGVFDKEGNLWVLESSLTGNVRLEKVSFSSKSSSLWIYSVLFGLVGFILAFRFIRNLKTSQLHSIGSSLL